MYDEHDSAYDQMEYELRPFDVTCSHCKRTAYASQMNLETIGWALSSIGEYCPDEKCQARFESDRQDLAAKERGWSIV